MNLHGIAEEMHSLEERSNVLVDEANKELLATFLEKKVNVIPINTISVTIREGQIYDYDANYLCILKDGQNNPKVNVLAEIEDYELTQYLPLLEFTDKEIFDILYSVSDEDFGALSPEQWKEILEHYKIPDASIVF